jgi:YgiT-type zinc finger domain-containing protein
MKNICPYCEAETEVEVFEKIEKVNIRGETMEVLAHPFYCLTCGEYANRLRFSGEGL